MRRDMPSLPKLAQALGLGDQPACYHCGAEVPKANWATATGQLDRAHVIDRWCGGSDRAWNLRPLCHDCHRKQPIFEPGEEAVALYWFTGNPRGGMTIRYRVNEFGEQLVFVHNGRMGLLFHDDDLMPGYPLVIHDEKSLRPFMDGKAAVLDGFILGGSEAAWVLNCLAEVQNDEVNA